MPGSNDQNEVERLIQLAESRGLPADVKPAEEFDIAVTPEEIRESTMKLTKHIDDPEGVPVHHTDLEVEARQEVVVSATRLDPERTWFFLGMMYALIRGIDRSVFEVFRAAGAPAFDVLTHRADRAVVEISGASFSKNPWSAIVQGIDPGLAAKFCAFLSSYRFKTGSPEVHGPGDDVWRVDWQDVRIADPFSETRVGVTIKVALPVNLRTGRAVRLVRPGGLVLATPRFGVVALYDDDEVKQYGS